MEKKYSTIFLISMAIIMCILKFYSNVLTLFIVLSTVLIYIISKKSPSTGLLTYIIVFLFILSTDYYHSIIFLFFYGVIGVFPGMFSHYLNKNILISIINGVILAISINGMNMTLRTSILSIQYSNGILLQGLILLFSIVCSFVTLVICNYIYDTLYKIENISN